MPVLFDRTCILCGRVLPAEKAQRGAVSGLCARVRTEYRYHGEFSVPGADGAAAALCYRGAVKEALHRFKFGGRPQYAAWFAAEMAAVLAAQLDRWQPPASRTCRSAFSAHGSAATIRPSCSRVRSRNHSRCPVFPRCASVRFTARQSVQQDAAARRKNAAGSLLPGAFRSQASASWSSTISSRPARPPQTPRTSCAAWAPPVFSCSRPQNRRLNRFSLPSLLSFVYSL